MITNRLPIAMDAFISVCVPRRPVLEYVYDVGFTDFRTGYAAAVSTLFFIVVLAVSAVWVFLTRRQEQGL